MESHTNRNQLTCYVNGTLLSAIDAWLLLELTRIVSPGIYVKPSKETWTLKESDRGRKNLRYVTGEFPTLKFDSE